MTSRLTLLLLVLALAGCGKRSPLQTVDAGPQSCDAPQACKAAGLDAVCRAGTCRTDVLCADDVECGLGELCQGGHCHFTGCTKDADCPSGHCRADVFACAECGQNSDCPSERPACSSDGRCVRCQSDSDCLAPGPSHCAPSSGLCVACVNDTQCPTGLHCDSTNQCAGAPEGAPCSETVGCDVGLLCVSFGSSGNRCAQECNLYQPTCSSGEICYAVSVAGEVAFDNGVPIGVCAPPVTGLRGYHEACSDNCEPNLVCIPDTATSSSCKTYCDPNAPSCAPNELCHAFPGDGVGHRYGLCYGDGGYGDSCVRPSDCPSGLACAPRPDPSTFDGLSAACRFAVGEGGSLAACSQDNQCQTGLCVTDPLFVTPPSFCYGACQADADCPSGTCDAVFPLFNSAFSGEVLGCRPRCSGQADCAAYGSGSDCVLRRSNFDTQLAQTCTTPTDGGTVGSPCDADEACADGYCLNVDGRQIVRAGLCTRPCGGDPDCPAPNAGVATRCEQVRVSVGGTSVATHLCAGGTCATDADCPAGTSCTLDADPANPSALVLVCRTPAVSANLGPGAPCGADPECQSGVCASVVSPDGGAPKVCFMPCAVGVTTCPGNLTCTTDAVRVSGSSQLFTACVP